MTTRYDDMMRDNERPSSKIEIGSAVSLKGCIVSTDNIEFTYPVMTVYDIFNVTDDYPGHAKCYWFLSGKCESNIFPVNILLRRG